LEENLIVMHNGDFPLRTAKLMTKRQILPFLLCLFSTLLCSSLAYGEMLKSSSSLGSKTPQRMQSATTAKPTIMLDAGHGGRDEGTKIHTFKEKKITLATVLYTKKYLEEMGYRVILTRARDVEMSLPRRVSLANKTRCSLFVSIHYNFSRNTEASGVEIFYYDSKEAARSKESRKLANYILHYVIDQTEASSRGVKIGNFHVIRETEMPAVLLEGGFVSNSKECSKLRKKEYLEQIAKGVALGIDKYFKLQS
jgi:N-acetylmuramoyl-L-alanine amidase